MKSQNNSSTSKAFYSIFMGFCCHLFFNLMEMTHTIGHDDKFIVVVCISILIVIAFVSLNCFPIQMNTVGDSQINWYDLEIVAQYK